MINLPLNEMIDKAYCRYMLVTAVAQRVRQLQSEPEILGDGKPVSVAVQELLNDELVIEPPKEYYQD